MKRLADFRNKIPVNLQYITLQTEEKVTSPDDETDNMTVLQHMVVTGDEEDLSFSDGTTIHIDPETAELILACYGRLTKENQQKFEEALNKSNLTFSKVLRFSKKHQN